MKFDEVINHIGKTAHLVASNLFTISLDKWNSLTPDQQATVQGCADNFEAALDQITLTQEAELEADMAANGMVIYTPDLDAFVANVKAVYAAEGQDADWPDGLFDAIVSYGR
jgi:TRAP-type C4-dicarboxylate transport system substrate-binding protein